MPRSRFASKLGEQHQIGDWDIRIIYTLSREFDAKTCIHEIQELLRAAPEGGAHVFAIQSPQPSLRDRSALQKSVCDVAHRMVWLPPSDAHGALENPESFWTKFAEKYLKFEAGWRDKLRPRGLGDPLLLPQYTFTYNCNEKSCFWDRARLSSPDYDADIDQIAAVIKAFIRERRVRRKSKFRDDKGLHFDFDGPRHGREDAALRKHKFTYFLRDFHYDVSREDNREFNVTDAHGQQRVARYGNGGFYLNVSAYGYIIEKQPA